MSQAVRSIYVTHPDYKNTATNTTIATITITTANTATAATTNHACSSDLVAAGYVIPTSADALEDCAEGARSHGLEEGGEADSWERRAGCSNGVLHKGDAPLNGSAGDGKGERAAIGRDDGRERVEQGGGMGPLANLVPAGT